MAGLCFIQKRNPYGIVITAQYAWSQMAGPWRWSPAG